MAKAPKLRRLLTQTKKTSDQTQRAFLKAEDQLTDLERREQARREREQR